MATLYAYSPNGTQATLPVKVMGFTQSLATNGWCKLPNGLIFQWCALTSSSYTTTGRTPVSNLLSISMTVYCFAGVNTHKEGALAYINGYYKSGVLILKMVGDGKFWSESGLVLFLGK